jgi:serine-type D-Ala-D-Ala carboxypeptidase/endopeptidase (penicillin-binding protein 4)
MRTIPQGLKAKRGQCGSAENGNLAVRKSEDAMNSLEIKYGWFPVQYKKGLRLILVLLFNLSLQSLPYAQDLTTIPSATNAFDSALAGFAALAPLQSASWGFCAVDVATRQTYRSVNEHTSLIPASTLKPFTMAPLFANPGGDYRFSTVVRTTGISGSDGSLTGNLIIYGGGDPTLGSQRFLPGSSVDTLYARIYQELLRKGITSVQGRIIGNSSLFGDMPVIRSWQWEDVGNYYGASSPALSVYENTISFVFEPGKREGEPAKLLNTIPPVPYLEIVNEVTTGARGSGDQVYVYGGPLSNLRWLTGTVPAGVKSFTVSGTLPDPPFHVAFGLHDYLISRGIEIAQPPTTSLRMKWMGEIDTLLPVSDLLIWQSGPLHEMVYYVNFRSVNLYAEMLIKSLGMLRYREGSTEAGLKAVQEYWSSKGLPLAGLSLKDGSGLSRKNLVTPFILANALVIVTKEGYYATFYNSFPVAGESGSVSSRFRKGAAKGNLRAKSGTLEGVKGFSGYATTASGRELAYSLIVNNYSGTHNDLMKEIETLLTKMCEIND